MLVSGPRRDELPRLDLLRSFEVAARTLSFTLAAKELHLTQSAVSRQIQAMEDGLGLPLFERRHRALALTLAGQIMQRAAQDCLQRLRDATLSVRAIDAPRRVSVTTTPGFASLWLIPRLAKFTASHPQVDVRVSATLDVLDLERADIDVAVRFRPTSDGVGQPLFEEIVVPVCAPSLLRGAAPLRQPSDLQQHTLLAMDLQGEMSLTADWEPWFNIMGLAELRVKNTLRFSLYSDAITAAVAGHGVAIGRLPLLNEYLRDGRLVTPLQGRAASQRAYFVELSPRAMGNADALDLVQWLRSEGELTAQAI